MKIPRNVLNQVVEVVMELGAKKATKYLSENLTVKATRRFKANKRSRSTDIVLTIGKPNYAERQFIKKCRRAGEPFPIKKLQIKMDK